MKIVWRSATDNRAVADVLECEHVHPWIANWMVSGMMLRTTMWDMYWPIVVEDDCPLWGGMAELV